MVTTRLDELLDLCHRHGWTCWWKQSAVQATVSTVTGDGIEMRCYGETVEDAITDIYLMSLQRAADYEQRQEVEP